jgi:hypothetical protein
MTHKRDIMDKLKMTEHAQHRKQQRGVTDIQLQLIHAFGEDHYQKGGCCLTSIPEKTTQKIRAALDGLNSIAIVKCGNERVVTVMHRDQRIHKTAYAA